MSHAQHTCQSVQPTVILSLLLSPLGTQVATSYLRAVSTNPSGLTLPYAYCHLFLV